MITTTESPLAPLPDDLKSIIAEFWQGLQVTARRAACPICRAPDLEVREARANGRSWSYVLHCAGAWLIEDAREPIG